MIIIMIIISVVVSYDRPYPVYQAFLSGKGRGDTQAQ